MKKASSEPRIDPSEPRFSTVQAATRLHLCPRVVGQKCAAGKIRATRPGRSWQIPESAISEYLNGGAN